MDMAIYDLACASFGSIRAGLPDFKLKEPQFSHCITIETVHELSQTKAQKTTHKNCLLLLHGISFLLLQRVQAHLLSLST